MPTSWPRFQTNGAAALALWDELRAQGRGWPIIVGDDEALEHFEQLANIPDQRSSDAILAAASDFDVAAAEAEAARGSISMADLFAAAGSAPAQASWLPPDLLAAMQAVNAKPYKPPVIVEPTVAHDYGGNPRAKVNVLLTPARAGFEVPAFARWGKGNGCPSPEHHVARLRDWHARFGAELVSMNHDTLELRVARRPSGKDEALALARDHLSYCSDNKPEPPDTIETYAEILRGKAWWYFWWD